MFELSVNIFLDLYVQFGVDDSKVGLRLFNLAVWCET